MNGRILFFLIAFSASARAAGPGDAGGFSFVAMSDSRGSDTGVNSAVLGTLADRLVKRHGRSDFVVFVGDMIGGSSSKPDLVRRQLEYWKEVMAPVYRAPGLLWPKIWPVGGNHEMQNARGPETFRAAFPDVFMNGPEAEKGLTYSFDHKGSHFVMILTDRIVDGARLWHSVGDLDWLDADLGAARKRGVRHIFVFGHDPAFPLGPSHIADGLPNIGRLGSGKEPNLKNLAHRDAFWDILVRHKAAIYFAGHEHLYGRQTVKGTAQIVTGGAGAPLYGLNPCPGVERKFRLRGGFMSYEDAKPYYEALGYEHGPGKTCQASSDFVGGSFHHYVHVGVSGETIRVETWGFDGSPGPGREPPPSRVMDAFTLGG